MAVTRELTKLHEEFWRGDLAGAIADYQQREPKGEYTIVVAGAVVVEQAMTPEAIQAALVELLQSGMSRSQASKQLAQEFNLSKREVYQVSLEIPD